MGDGLTPRPAGGFDRFLPPTENPNTPLTICVLRCPMLEVAAWKDTRSGETTEPRNVPAWE